MLNLPSDIKRIFAVSESTPQTVYLNEYQVSAFLIEKTELVFDLGDDYSLVTATLTITRNPQSCDKDSP